MKKFYFFLVAMVLGVMSASAVDYYLAGGFSDANWQEKNAKYKFTDAGNGQYTYKYEGTLAAEFKITDGTWTNSWGGNGNKVKEGVPYVCGTTSANCALETPLTNPTLTWTPATKTLLVTGEAGEVEYSYCLHGNLPAGGASWADTELDNVAGTAKWEIEGLEVATTCNFGIKKVFDGAQAAWIFGATGYTNINAAGTYNTVVEGQGGGANFSITAGVWDLSFDADAMTLTVKKTGESESEISYCIHGNLADEGGMAWTNIELTNSAENVWSVSDVVVGNSNGTPQFGIKPILDGVATDGWIALPKSGQEEYVLVQSGTYQLVDNNTTNIALAAGTYDFSFDASTMKITITRHGGDLPTPELPATLYIIGNAAGTLPTGGWDPSKGIADNTAEDGVYTWNSVDMKDAGDGNSYFSLVTALGADWDADVNSSNRYGSVANDALVTPNEAAEIVLFQAGINASSATSWKIAAGTYKIVADLNNMTLTATQTNSVAAIEAEENVAPVYYNLQGVRVDAPANGLYIVVRGDKVAKELVK